MREKCKAETLDFQKQRLWFARGNPRGALLPTYCLRLLVDFQSHDPPCAIQFQSPSAFKHRVTIHARNGDKDLFFNQRGRVRAVEIFQRSAAAAGLRQAKSQIGKLTGFSNGNGIFHQMAAFNVSLLIRGIKSGLERDVIMKTLFLRVVNATRDSEGHKEERNFYHIPQPDARHYATISRSPDHGVPTKPAFGLVGVGSRAITRSSDLVYSPSFSKNRIMLSIPR